MSNLEIALRQEASVKHRATLKPSKPRAISKAITQPAANTSTPIGAASESAPAAVRVPKKRGPKKKQLTPERVVRLKQRRARANDRERSRMHGLNGALEQLRRHIPCFTNATRLSKIETLRLARNYIGAISDVLAAGVQPDALAFGRALVEGLSHNSINLVANYLHVSPHLLALPAMAAAAANDFSNAAGTAFGEIRELLCRQSANSNVHESMCWPPPSAGLGAYQYQQHQNYQQPNVAPDSTSHQCAPAQSSSAMQYECSAADTLRQMALLVELGPKRVGVGAGFEGSAGGCAPAPDSALQFHPGLPGALTQMNLPMTQLGSQSQVLPSYAQSPTTPSNYPFKPSSWHPLPQIPQNPQMPSVPLPLPLPLPGPQPVGHPAVYEYTGTPLELVSSSPSPSWPQALGNVQPSALVTTPSRTLGSPPGPSAPPSAPAPPPLPCYTKHGHVLEPGQHAYFHTPTQAQHVAGLALAQTPVVPGTNGTSGTNSPACCSMSACYSSLPVAASVPSCESSALPPSAYSPLDQLPLPSHSFSAQRVPVR